MYRSGHQFPEGAWATPSLLPVRQPQKVDAPVVEINRGGNQHQPVHLGQGTGVHSQKPAHGQSNDRYLPALVLQLFYCFPHLVQPLRIRYFCQLPGIRTMAGQPQAIHRIAVLVQGLSQFPQLRRASGKPMDKSTARWLFPSQ